MSQCTSNAKLRTSTARAKNGTLYPKTIFCNQNVLAYITVKKIVFIKTFLPQLEYFFVVFYSEFA